MEFYKKNIEETIKELTASKEKGLSRKEAASRLLKHGKNVIWKHCPMPTPEQSSLLRVRCSRYSIINFMPGLDMG